MKTIRTRIYNELVDDDGKVTTETLELRVVDGCVAGQIKIGKKEQRWADLRSFTTHVPLHCEVLRHLLEVLPEATVHRIPGAVGELCIKRKGATDWPYPLDHALGQDLKARWDLLGYGGPHTLEQDRVIALATEFSMASDPCRDNKPSQEEFDKIHLLLTDTLDELDGFLFRWRHVMRVRGYLKDEL